MFSGISNLRIHKKISQNFSSFLLRSIEIKNVAKTVDFHKNNPLCSSFTEKTKHFFCEKKLWIRRLGIRENMQRASYKCDTLYISSII
jgi:hypothetical protein